MTRYVMIDEDGNEYVVRDATLTPISDYMLYTYRSVTKRYEGGVVTYEAERRKHHLMRVWDGHDNSIRYYWRRLRVPWIVWAMFS